MGEAVAGLCEAGVAESWWRCNRVVVLGHRWWALGQGSRNRLRVGRGTARPYQPQVEGDPDQWHTVGLRCVRPKFLGRAEVVGGAEPGRWG